MQTNTAGQEGLMMRDTRSLDAIRSEHSQLLPHVEGLRDAADALDLPGRAAFRLVDDAWRFLSEHLMVHAAWEQHVLYPALTRTLGAPEAVTLLTLDHTVISGLTAELRVLRRQLADHDDIDSHLKNELRRVLFGLFAVVEAHFQKEEDVVLPLLEARLAPTDVEQLVRTMWTQDRGSL